MYFVYLVDGISGSFNVCIECSYMAPLTMAVIVMKGLMFHPVGVLVLVGYICRVSLEW